MASDDKTTDQTDDPGSTPPVSYITGDAIVFEGDIWQGKPDAQFYELLLRIIEITGIQKVFPTGHREVTYAVAEDHDPEGIRQQLIELLSPTHVKLCSIDYIFTLTGRVQIYLRPSPDAPFGTETLEFFRAGVDGVDVLGAGIFLSGNAMVVCQMPARTSMTTQRAAEELAAKLANLLGYAATRVDLQDVSFFALV